MRGVWWTLGGMRDGVGSGAVGAAGALKAKRLRYGGIGLALVGAGVSVAADAGHRRAAGESSWVARGTLGLCLLGAGLSVFGEAVAVRAEQRMKRRYRR